MIYNESCVDTISRLKDDEVDHVITSPPYNMNLRIRNGKYCSRQIVKELSTKYEGFDDNLPIDDFYTLHSSILEGLLRITSGYIFYNIAIVTGPKRAFFRMIGEYADQLKEIIVWDKGVAQPAMQELVLNRQSELILVFSKNGGISRQFSKACFERGTISDTWKIKREAKITDAHGATFPTALVEKIITNFTRPGELIYDPFTGTGTTGFVSKRMGRRFIGSELSKKYCDIANERIESELI